MRKKGIIFFLNLLLGIVALPLLSQIRLEVIELPPLQVKENKLYVTGSFNNWNPGDAEYALQKSENGYYWIDLPFNLDSFDYKFTQGNWVLTEGTNTGDIRANRRYIRTKENDPKRIQVIIEGWEKKPGYTFIVKLIPQNTPSDAAIYVAGNFNNWNPADPSYKFKKQADGTYRLLFITDLTYLEFKFTRGTWESVESKSNGKVRPNRKTPKEKLVSSSNVSEFEVMGWEDLTGTFNIYSIYELLMIFAVLQGLLFIIAIPSTQDYNRKANFWLILLMSLSSLMILFRVLGQFRGVSQNMPKIQLIPDFTLFLYAPLYYFYITRLLFQASEKPKQWYLHFIPAIVLFFLYLPYFLSDDKIFELKMVNNDWDMRLVFLIIGALAFIFNTFYWFQSLKVIKIYKEQYMTRYSYEQNLQYLNSVQFIQAVCLSLWLFGYILIILGFVLGWEVEEICNRNIDGIWLVFSTINYFLGYVAIKQPEVFKVPQPQTIFETPISENTEGVLPVIENIGQPLEIENEKPLLEDLDILKEQIQTYMIKNKPFTNSNLTLNELAQKLKLQPHILSKAINQGFHKNFFDFINSYRIEEFKTRMDNPKYQHFTLISIAYEVGFNSKTAFNRSFKKMTNQTPSEYYNR